MTPTNATSTRIDLANGVLTDVRELVDTHFIGLHPVEKFSIDGLTLESVKNFVGSPEFEQQYTEQLGFMRSRMSQRLSPYFGVTASGISFVVLYQETVTGFQLHVGHLPNGFPHSAPMQMFDAVRGVAKHHDIDEPFEVALTQLGQLPSFGGSYLDLVLKFHVLGRLVTLLDSVRIQCDWSSSVDSATYTFTRR